MTPIKFLYELLYWYPSYFTNWALTSITLFMNNFIPHKHTESIILLSNISLIGGFYISNINPKYVYTEYFGGKKLEGYQLYSVDFIFHTLPGIVLYSYLIKNNIIITFKFPYLALLICSIYIFFNSPIKRYNVTKKDIIIIIGNAYLLLIISSLIQYKNLIIINQYEY
jgi:hypothetical protein